MPNRRSALLLIIFIFFTANLFAQIRVRLLTDNPPGIVVFTVAKGTYRIKLSTSKVMSVKQGESVIITRLNNRLAVKTRNENGFSCDSFELSMADNTSSFSLRTDKDGSLKRIYNGNLVCKSDLESVLLINKPDIEDYIAGVVFAEGGGGASSEFFKTQATIVRTYLYKYKNKHLNDGFNLCDDVHCQVFHGITTSPLIIQAVAATKGEVITDMDSVLIISAFHSNCGGETASSADVWLTAQPYLKKVIDPYCLTSANAKWEKKISLQEWSAEMKKNGFTGAAQPASLFNFSQSTRKVNYSTGTFSLPLSSIRNDLGLKSTFFSVEATGDYLILQGRGYGHGVGLCQEGAMAMAKTGMDYKKIIQFYYSGVQIMDIADVKLYGNE